MDLHSMNPAQRLMAGIAIGDTFGLGYEWRGKRADIAAAFDPTAYKSHIWATDAKRRELAKQAGIRVDPPHQAGMFSDDSQMSMAAAEWILDLKHLTAEELAKKLIEYYRRDPIFGYSPRVEKALLAASSPDDFIAKLDSRSTGNGAAIRAAPLGVLPDVPSVIHAAVTSAKLTHDTANGISSSICVALAAHYFYYGIHSPSLFDYIIPWCERFDQVTAKHLRDVEQLGANYPTVIGAQMFEIAGVELDGIPCDGALTAGAVLYLLDRFRHQPWELLKNAVLLGGDTDSVASPALGIALIHSGLRSFPPFLWQDLNNQGPHRRDYLVTLGERLHQQYPPKT